MEFVASAAKVLLNAAHVGELEQLKRSAAAIDHVIGVGIPGILENTEDDDGRSAIHYAAAGGRVNVLKYLVEEIKLDVDVKTNSGKTPLSCASVEGRLAAVEYLLEMGANPEIQDDTSRCPLHHVAVKGHKDVIPLLLSKGINVDVSDGNGSPLQYAAVAGKHDTVNVLLDHGANPNLILFDMFPPLLASIHTKSWQCAEALLKAGADPNGGPDGIKPLPVAAELGVIQIIKPLVEAGADPNFRNIVS
ncbi:hypothetical protein MKX03_011532 [Papaver bracteatum]|nr:hypothetical protein MKX03_011532 [Papaver bracteatum]